MCEDVTMHGTDVHLCKHIVYLHMYGMYGYISKHLPTRTSEVEMGTSTIARKQPSAGSGLHFESWQVATRSVLQSLSACGICDTHCQGLR